VELGAKLDTQPYKLFGTILLLSHRWTCLDHNFHALFVFYEGASERYGRTVESDIGLSVDLILRWTT